MGINNAILGMGGYFSSPIDDPEVIIRYAYNNGIRFFDTSPAYGTSEESFGNALKSFPRHTYTLSTKTKSFSGEEVYLDFVTSRTKLRTDYLDIYFGHDFINDMESWEACKPALKEMVWMKNNGLIRAIGVSGHSPEATRRAIECGVIDYIMIPHSIMFRAFEELIIYAKQKNVKVITMKNFGSGILLGGNAKDSQYKKDVPLRDIMSFTSWFTGVDIIIPAYRSKTQLTEIQMAYEESHPFTEEETVSLISKIKKHLGDDFCRFCNLCRPCDVHGWSMSQPGILKSFIYDKNFNLNMDKTYNNYRLNVKDCSGCDSVCSVRCPFGIDIKESMGIAHMHFITKGEVNNGKQS